MKKQLAVLLLALVLHLTITGCSAANAVQKIDAAEDHVEEKLDRAEDKLEAGLREITIPSETRMDTVPESTPAEIPPAVTESTAILTKEQAQKIALDYLGLTADQVTRMRAEYEIDDGISQYDVEFHQGNWEYEFEIHAENGTIISFDKDYD